MVRAPQTYNTRGLGYRLSRDTSRLGNVLPNPFGIDAISMLMGQLVKMFKPGLIVRSADSSVTLVVLPEGEIGFPRKIVSYVRSKG